MALTQITAAPGKSSGLQETPGWKRHSPSHPILAPLGQDCGVSQETWSQLSGATGLPFPALLCLWSLEVADLRILTLPKDHVLQSRFFQKCAWEGAAPFLASALPFHSLIRIRPDLHLAPRHSHGRSVYSLCPCPPLEGRPACLPACLSRPSQKARTGCSSSPCILTWIRGSEPGGLQVALLMPLLLLQGFQN